MFFPRTSSVLQAAVLAVMLLMEGCRGFASIHHHAITPRGSITFMSAAPQPESSDKDRTSSVTSRRTIIRTLSAATLMLVQGSHPAMALKDRNEALCGTGFFTNIALYKCTEIGDISDEGKSQPLSSTEEGSMQSLLSKMGMEDMEIVEDGDKGENQGTNSRQGSKAAEPTR
jgi:hypothetical protein